MLDTNIVLYYVGGLQDIPNRDIKLLVSVLTVFESLRYPGIGNEEENRLRHFLNRCARLPVSDEIAQRAAFMGRSRSKNTIDLLIAATALEHALPLVTKNVKDFQDIKGLTVLAAV